MPYRLIDLPAENGAAETHWIRVDDRAVAEWLPERARLRRRGYPDRPPDIDTPTLRAWLARPGEQGLPYFRDGQAPSAAPGDTFPVFTATWHLRNGVITKVLVTGMADGSFLSRVVVVEPSGDSSVDKAHRLGPDLDPDAVWAEVETIVRFINEAPMAWGPEDPMVNTYPDFIALDGEIEVAEAEAREVGLLAPEWVH